MNCLLPIFKSISKDFAPKTADKWIKFRICPIDIFITLVQKRQYDIE